MEPAQGLSAQPCTEKQQPPQEPPSTALAEDPAPQPQPLDLLSLFDAVLPSYILGHVSPSGRKLLRSVCKRLREEVDRGVTSLLVNR